ncbi:MAG: hydantoinase B/oxoprolinase family protein, partial [Syntrophales bacterium]|nr:hydantoinase B/oxoprolinase family protein [Syntrophales bacterium]
MVHILNVTQTIQYMKKNRYPEDPGINAGDAFINNDPLIGGMHCPDCALVAPFFHQGELVGYVASIAHTTEMGAVEPGGVPATATEFCHDGLHLPAVKLMEKGRLKKDIWALWLRAVRDPRGVELDTRAKIAANERVSQRLKELIDEVGIEFFKMAGDQLIEDTVEATRAKIKRLKPGIYGARCYHDAAGVIIGDKLAVVEVEIEVAEEGELFFRVPVVSPQVRGFNNCHSSSAESLLFCILLQTLFYDIRWNTGIAKLVHLDIPKGSRISADPTASVAYAPVGIGYTFQTVCMEAISRCLYLSGIKEDVEAGGNGAMNASIISGLDQFGRTFGNILAQDGFGSGGGGRIGRDGHDSSVANYNPWQYYPDCEGDEMIAPVIHLLSLHRSDSGGFGKYRGGTATWAIDVVHKSSMVYTSHMGAMSKLVGGNGIFGGYPAACQYTARFVNTDFYEKVKDGFSTPLSLKELLESVKGELTRTSSSIATQYSKPGDMIIATGLGGGGLGDPLERDPDLIVKDLRDEKTSLSLSQKVYCLAIDPKTLEVDLQETQRIREEKRRERLSQGITGKEFVRLLVERRKKRDLPKVVLDYLDETASFSEAFREELKEEEEFSKRELEPLEVKIKRVISELTYYTNLIENNDEGRVFIACNKCNHIYC